MAERKTPNKGYQKLKSDLSAGNIGQVYIFYGEESYLREYYLGEIKKKLNEILAERTGKSYEEISRDTERDNFLTAQQALEYGLIDRVISHR